MSKTDQYTEHREMTELYFKNTFPLLAAAAQQLSESYRDPHQHIRAHFKDADIERSVWDDLVAESDALVAAVQSSHPEWKVLLLLLQSSPEKEILLADSLSAATEYFPLLSILLICNSAFARLCIRNSCPRPFRDGCTLGLSWAKPSLARFADCQAELLNNKEVFLLLPDSDKAFLAKPDTILSLLQTSAGPDLQRRAACFLELLQLAERAEEYEQLCLRVLGELHIVNAVSEEHKQFIRELDSDSCSYLLDLKVRKQVPAWHRSLACLDIALRSGCHALADEVLASFTKDRENYHEAQLLTAATLKSSEILKITSHKNNSLLHFSGVHAQSMFWKDVLGAKRSSSYLVDLSSAGHSFKVFNWLVLASRECSLSVVLQDALKALHDHGFRYQDFSRFISPEILTLATDAGIRFSVIEYLLDSCSPANALIVMHSSLYSPEEKLIMVSAALEEAAPLTEPVCEAFISLVTEENAAYLYSACNDSLSHCEERRKIQAACAALGGNVYH